MDQQLINIPLPADFNFQECLWFLDRNFDDCMYRVYPDEVVRAFDLGNGPVLVSLKAPKDELLISVLEGKLPPEHVQPLKNLIAGWFDLDISLAPFYILLEKHEQLAYMTTAYHGLRMIGIPDLFEAVCWAIIGQQINLSFAYKLKRRLVERFGRVLLVADQPYYLFPDCHVLAGVDVDELLQMQFSRSKAAYLKHIATAFASGELSRELLELLPDIESKQRALTAIKGIGVWTANYALMKSMKERSCIPYGDAGLLNALIAHHLISSKKAYQEIDTVFNRFQGWESYLVFYLWRSLAEKSTV